MGMSMDLALQLEQDVDFANIIPFRSSPFISIPETHSQNVEMKLLGCWDQETASM